MNCSMHVRIGSALHLIAATGSLAYFAFSYG
jgi:hypothetical protein